MDKEQVQIWVTKETRHNLRVLAAYQGLSLIEAAEKVFAKAMRDEAERRGIVYEEERE